MTQASLLDLFAASGPAIDLVNVGSALEPSWRMSIDGVLVARAGSEEALRPLRLELAENASKASALRDAFLRSSRCHEPKEGA